MAHDIIDNRNEKLVEHIEVILSSSERIKFAVGYLFLSGLKPIRKELEKLKEIRLLIGNTTNRQTIETLAAGYKRLELLEDAVEDWRYPKRTVIRQSVKQTAENLRDAISLMNQTDDDEEVIKTVLRLIKSKKLKVRVFTKGCLHAKAYIFDYGKVYNEQGKPVPREEKGIAIVGSSNLTIAGISHNTELNVIVNGNDNHAELNRWFDELWDESQDFSEELMQELKLSWAGQIRDTEQEEQIRPYDVYMKRTCQRTIR